MFIGSSEETFGFKFFLINWFFISEQNQAAQNEKFYTQIFAKITLRLNTDASVCIVKNSKKADLNDI